MDSPQSNPDAVTPLRGAKWLGEVHAEEGKLRAYLQRRFPRLTDIDDVVQESHLRLLRAQEAGVITSAKAYLFAIARNVALGVFRKTSQVTQVSVNEFPDSDILIGDADVAETASIQQEFAIAIEIIDRLPGRCREIVILRALHGLSHREIAARLGLSESTVRVQVARGMKKCADHLRERGICRPSP